MKTTNYLGLILISFLLSSCVNDKPSAPETITENSTTTQQKPAATTTNTNQPVTKVNAPSSTATRPTENIKVTLPNGKTTSTSPKPTLGATATAKPAAVTERKQDFSSEEEKRMIKEREAKQAELDRKIVAAPPKQSKPVEVAKDALPSACDLLSAEFVSQTIGSVEARDIYVKDGSGKKAVNARSCFFKWDNGGNPNAGVLVQIQKNPLPDEFPDWASYLIRAKRDQGDQMPDGSGSYRYKDFPGMGLAGAYNYDLARYTWRTDTGNVFVVAFNLQSSEAEQLIWAEKIGKEAMRNFANLKK